MICSLFPELFKRFGFNKKRRNAVVRIYVRGYLPEDMTTSKVPKDAGYHTKKGRLVSSEYI
jgi:hypothetical protein